ncbi:FMN reductase [Halorientalis sp. IM1011]|uniref:NADPH-dependent FMN reductase n=1 Tax=Halorientalis sp. IM1011 TaxID=1932360 RepID=UPI00097CCA3B|nr:NAD(P)H-dependent oxidoreductase [Halorientalis sp. IM1011]AQL44179.1 FMN reductase [Halorientalis sp. IM1011]
MSRPHIVGICGSLRDDSHTRKGLEHALDAAAATGGETELLDLRDWDLPVYDADAGEAGDAPTFTARVRAADAILLGTPVYHGSYATPLKNALDYCGFDEFENKTVGLLAVAGGGFPITALEHLRTVCRALNAWVIPHQAAIPRASNAFEGDADDWGFVDESVADRVAILGRRAVEYATIEPDPPCIESTENVGADD